MMKKFLALCVGFVMCFACFACGNGDNTQTDNYVDYIDNFAGFTPTIGDKVNNESLDDLVAIYGDETAKTVKVQPVEIADDFAFGVDISSIIDVEKNGGVFYNFEGKQQDVFEILKDNGVNYVRIRLWNNPFDTLFDEPYGGGNNDILTDIAIAKRASRVGMKICLDFHYSDFWADPGKQVMPFEWRNIKTAEDAAKAVYDYTYEVIKAFEQEGVRPHMVQIGNEINTGMMHPIGSTSKGFDNLALMLKQGCKAVKDISTKIQTVIHIAEGASEQKVDYFYSNIIDKGVEFDIIGLSYYSYWHGSIDKLNETLKMTEEKFKKKVAIMEYSYGYTDYSNSNSANIFNSEMEREGGFKTSIQGQSTYIREVNSAVANIKGGVGTFYWEPAWLSVPNAGWASSGAKDWLELNGEDAGNLDKTTWANQALFSFSGKALPSLKTFNTMKTAQAFDESIIEITQEIDSTINILENETIPAYTMGLSELHSRRRFLVVWNKAELDAIVAAGNYVVNGTVTSGGKTFNIVCNVTAIENYLKNASFEKGGKVGSDVSNFDKVDSWSGEQSVAGALKVESKNPRTEEVDGSNNLNVYHSAAFTFKLTQSLQGLSDGQYTLKVWARSSSESSGAMPSVKLFATSGGITNYSDFVGYGSGWSVWNSTSLTFTVSGGTATLGLDGSGKANDWAHFDDFSLVKIA